MAQSSEDTHEISTGAGKITPGTGKIDEIPGRRIYSYTAQDLLVYAMGNEPGAGGGTGLWPIVGYERELALPKSSCELNILLDVFYGIRYD